MAELVRDIAHDLNNQLAVIINYASFVFDDLDDPPQLQEDIAEIRAAADRARDLTQRLLGISSRVP